MRRKNRKQEKHNLSRKKKNFRRLQDKRRVVDSIWLNKNEKMYSKNLMMFIYLRKNKRSTLPNMLNNVKKKDI